MPDVFINRIEEGGLVVVTNDAEDVRVGTRFNQLCTMRALGQATDLSFEKIETTGVDLVVEEILIFRKQVEVLPRGYSAAFRLSGDGMRQLESAVKRKDKREHVHLQAAI